MDREQRWVKRIADESRSRERWTENEEGRRRRELGEEEEEMV